MTTIGKNIAYFRKKAGFTQEELSEIMNITSQAISKWENDLSYPDLVSTKELASALNVSIDELLNGEVNYPIATDADAEQIARRILVICIQIEANEAYGTRASSVTARIPVSVLLNAHNNGTLKELVGESASLVGESAFEIETAIGMIKEGVIGTLVDAHTEGNSIRIMVEDHEN